MNNGAEGSFPFSGALQDNHFRSLLETLPDATFVHVEGEFVYVNPATVELLGVPDAASLLGRSVLDFVPRENREVTQSRIDQTQSEPNRCEERILRADGSILDVEATCVVVALNGQRAIQTVLRDISERKSLESQLRQAQKMEAIGTLAGGIAHDFNNILGAIVAFTELARLEAENLPPVLDNLDEVMKASHRAKDLVSQIMTFSRQQTKQKRALQLGMVLKEALRLLRPTLPSSIQITSDIKPDAPAVFADQSQVHQILMNLCTNAAHAIGRNKGRIEIRLEPVTEIPAPVHGQPSDRGCFAKMSVTDNGHGMPRETMERIFDPFFTTKGPREGTGLGLAVVHGIMEDHDGAIRVQSEPGRGTTFELFFPACDPESHVPLAPRGKLQRGAGERILVIDDEPALAHVTQRVLQRLGYETSAETDPSRALDRFRKNPHDFDLVLSDLTMPNTTGAELVVEILKLRPSMPVLVCTGFSSYWEREALQSMGVLDLLYKPLSPPALAEAIHKALHKNEKTNSR